LEKGEYDLVDAVSIVHVFLGLSEVGLTLEEAPWFEVVTMIAFRRLLEFSLGRIIVLVYFGYQLPSIIEKYDSSMIERNVNAYEDVLLVLTRAFLGTSAYTFCHVS